MLGNGILDKIVEGSYETELTPLRMENGYGERFEGHGTLRWTREDGVTIDALTDGAESLLNKFGKRPCGPGQLIPPEHYLRLNGDTRSGASVTIDRIYPDDYHIHTNHPSVVWKVRSSSP